MTTQGFQSPFLAPDLLKKQYQMQQNQRYAQMLMQQGQEQPQGQMVSGHYVAPSITQHLANALKTYTGRRMIDDMPNQMADLQRDQMTQQQSMFGFGQPQVGIDDGVPGFTPAQGGMGQQGMPQSQGPMLLPGMDDQQSLAVLNSVGVQEYAKLLAKAMTQRGTSAMQNAEAMGLQPGTPEYSAYIERVTGSPQTVVNVGGDAAPGLGKLSSDYGYVLDPETRQPVIDPATGLPRAAPVPGSPAAQEIQDKATQAQLRQKNIARAGGTVVQDIGRALTVLESDSPLAAGAGAIVGQMLPESDAQALDGFYKSILGNVGFDQLQSMRESSPTGGALGAINQSELEFLQGILGRLNITDRRDIQIDNLKRINNIYMDRIHGTPEQIMRAYQRGDINPQTGKPLTLQDIEPLLFRYELSFDDMGRPVDQKNDSEPATQSGAEVPTINSPDQLQNLPSGTVFRAPDGSLRRVP